MPPESHILLLSMRSDRSPSDSDCRDIGRDRDSVSLLSRMDGRRENNLDVVDECGRVTDVKKVPIPSFPPYS